MLLNQLRKYRQKLWFWRYQVVFLTLSLGIILFSWVARSQQPVTVNLLLNTFDAQSWKQVVVKNFEAENPGIRINVIEGPNSSNAREDLFTSAFILGNSPYDLIYMDIIWVSKFAAAGWLLDLSDRISPQELAAFSPQDVEGGRYKGRLYRIPMRSDMGLLYYRKDLLAAAGYEPPETFEDLIKISQSLQQQGKTDWGYVWQGRQYEGLVAMFVEVLAGFGGFWIDPNTLEVGLERPETLQAIEFLRNTIKQSISPPGVTIYQEEETRRFFQSGEAVFLRSWPYVWPLANRDPSPIKGKIAIKLMVHAPGKSGGASLGGWGLGIAKSSKYPDAAWKVIQYFTSREAQRQFTLQADFVPSRRDLFTDPEIIAKHSHYPQLIEILQQAVLRPPLAQYAQVSDILQRYLSAALSDRLTPVAAMKAAAEETRRLLQADEQAGQGNTLRISNR